MATAPLTIQRSAHAILVDGTCLTIQFGGTSRNDWTFASVSGEACV